MIKKWIGLACASGLIAILGMCQDQPKGMTTHIGVRGEWTIEVYEPDGTLVDTRQFHNALVGPAVITQIFDVSHQSSHGGWYIALYGDSAGPCNGTCFLGETGMPPGGLDSQNVVVSVSGTLKETLTLAGSVTATTTDNIAIVDTIEKSCDSDIKPSDCFASTAGYYEGSLTSHTLSSPLAVTAGQIVQVTVNITFSTAP